MRNLMLMATLFAGPAFAADSAIEIGAHAGVFVFDDRDQLNTSWYLTPRIGYWFNHSVGIELDVGLSTGEAGFPDHGFLMVAPQLGFIGNPIPESKNAPVQPIITLNGGLMYKSVDGAGIRGNSYAHERFEGMFSIGTGLIVPIVGPLSFRTDVRGVFTGAAADDLYKEPYVDFEWTAGLAVKFDLAKDTDKDGIPDKSDLCISDPEDVDSFEDMDGCPDPDNDSDGVEDVNDGCPIDAEDMDGWEDADGCPDPDNDGDGLLDGDDTCPDEAGTQATGGCPDRDGDLIADEQDVCPDDAGLPEFIGCPDTDGDGLPDPDDECPTEVGPIESFGCPDNDVDRVPNYRDACPDKAVPSDVDAKRSDGCPARVYVAKGSIQITETIYFASGKDVIRSSSYGLLNDIAAVLNKYPEIKQVRVEGHTDSSGNDDANMALSKARAAAVVAYLTDKGDVDAARLTSEGYGETQPVADNKTSAGRAKNRRVAFTIVDQAQVLIDAEEAEAAEEAIESDMESLKEEADAPTE